jgi:hypothetical protein
MRTFRFWALLCLATCAHYAAAEPLWLSDEPPDPAMTARLRSAHGGWLEPGPRGTFFKRLWLRAGEAPGTAGYVVAATGGELLVQDPAGVHSTPSADPTGKHSHWRFPVAQEGFYDVYLTRRQVRDTRLHVSVAKAEVLKHSCREGHDDVQSKMPPKHLADIPLELVRERLHKEDFHTRLGFGDTVTFRVLAHGAPVAGAEVTLTTASGWRNTVHSDAEGRARFTLVRDYFPDWADFDYRHRQDFLVVATRDTDESGTLDGAPYARTRYQATLAGQYHPSSRDYQSYAYGLTIGLFGLSFGGLGAYIYRRRRTRPFREVRFHD